MKGFFTLVIPPERGLLFQQLGHRLGYFGELWYKTTVVASQAEEAPNLMDRCRLFPIHDLLYLSWVDSYSITRYCMTQELYLIQPELALRELGVQLVVSQALENHSEMLSMLGFRPRVDKNVVDEDHDKLIQLGHKHRVHQIHEVCWSIGQTKGHHQILITTIAGRKGGLGYVTWPDLYLMVARS